MTANTPIDSTTKNFSSDELPYLDIIKDSQSLHQHYQKIRLQTPLSMYSLLVESGLISAAQLQETLRQYIKTSPEPQQLGIVLGFGYDDSQLKEQRHPTREGGEAGGGWGSGGAAMGALGRHVRQRAEPAREGGAVGPAARR